MRWRAGDEESDEQQRTAPASYRRNYANAKTGNYLDNVTLGSFEPLGFRPHMPGTQLGVDVYPGRDGPLDLKSYSQRLKDYGTALRVGDETMITKVKVKGDHIELQLGGGGYRTIRDDTETSVTVTPTEKSRREKDLDQ